MNLLHLLKNWFFLPATAPAHSAAAQQLQVRPLLKVPAVLPLKTPVQTPAVAGAAAEAEKTPLRTARLIMVSAHNNNKFYEMKELPDGTFTVSYGRVGAAGTATAYPIRLWDRKLQEKIRKGYVDQTYLFADAPVDAGLDAIEHPGIRELMSFLMQAARQSIRHNYRVSAEEVTQLQVDQAQLILDQLAALVALNGSIKDVNEHLLDLYRLIPRRMKHVQAHLIKALDNQHDRDEAEKLLAGEQATLDVMRGQVKVNEQRKEKQAKPQSLLQSMGLHMEAVTESNAIGNIRRMMGKDAAKFHRAYAVVNRRTQQAFDDHLAGAGQKDIKLFWHGSRNENWMSILGGGLVLRPANAVISGKMFGYGLYFADKCRKSLNYTSLRGSYWASGSQNRAYLALYDVHVGRQLKVKHHQPWCYELSSEALHKKGSYDSLFAEGGADLVNNEYIVYNEAQCTVRYLVELRD